MTDQPISEDRRTRVELDWRPWFEAPDDAEDMEPPADPRPWLGADGTVWFWSDPDLCPEVFAPQVMWSLLFACSDARSRALRYDLRCIPALRALERYGWLHVGTDDLLVSPALAGSIDPLPRRWIVERVAALESYPAVGPPGDPGDDTEPPGSPTPRPRRPDPRWDGAWESAPRLLEYGRWGVGLVRVPDELAGLWNRPPGSLFCAARLDPADDERISWFTNPPWREVLSDHAAALLDHLAAHGERWLDHDDPRRWPSTISRDVACWAYGELHSYGWVLIDPMLGVWVNPVLVGAEPERPHRWVEHNIWVVWCP